MSNSPSLTTTKEDYIRAIYRLETRKEKTGVTHIAACLSLSKSTVSERLKELERDGFVKADPYTEISLTKKGFLAGEKLTFKHRILEVFLYKTLKMHPDKVHGEAEKLEHACSDEVIQLLANFLGNPETDPHGSKIPVIKKW